MADSTTRVYLDVFAHLAPPRESPPVEVAESGPAPKPAPKPPKPPPDDDDGPETPAPGKPRTTERRAEQALLGGLLIDGEALDGVRSLLSVHDFADRRHRLIFGAMCQLRDQGDPVDFVLLEGLLDEQGHLPDPVGSGYLTGLCLFCCSSLRVPEYARRVARNAALRRGGEEPYPGTVALR